MTTAGGRDPSLTTADLQRVRSAELQVVNKTGAGGQDPSRTDDKGLFSSLILTTTRGQDPSLTDDDRRPGRQEARTQASQTTTGGQDPSLNADDRRPRPKPQTVGGQDPSLIAQAAFCVCGTLLQRGNSDFACCLSKQQKNKFSTPMFQAAGG